MATSRSSKDVNLTLSIETLGKEDIDKLKQAVQQLAREGGDAAPEFQKLADSIDKLGADGAALRAFQQLAEETQRLATEQQEAAARATELGGRLDTARSSTMAYADAAQRARGTFDGLKKEQNELGGELQKLRAQYDAAGKKSDEYQTAQAKLVDRLTAVKNELVDGTTALRTANSEYSAAVSAQARLEKSFTAANAAARQTEAAFRGSSAAFQEAGAAAEALGVSTADVATEQARLIASFNQVGAAASSLKARIDAEAAAQAEAAAIALKTVSAREKLVASLTDQIRFTRQAADEQSRASEQAAAAISNAFGTIGVRSVQAVETELREVRAAMTTVATAAGATGAQLNVAFSAGNARIAELERELRALNGQLTLGDRAAGLFANSMGLITAGNVIADGVGYLVNKVKDLGGEFFSVNLEAQRLQKALALVYKDTATAGKQFDFLKTVANGAGVSVGSISDAFLRFSAATASSSISLASSNAVFTQVTRASGVLGLQADQVTGILEALGQMASKGTISLEELRGQLGDRLPGALSIAAKGLGVTEDKLISLVESGNLTTRTFFPAFEQGLIKTFGTGSEKIEGFIQGWNRLKNAITAVAQEASNSSFFNILGKSFDLLATNVRGVVTALELLAERLLIVKAIDAIASFTGLGRAAATSATQIEAKAAATTADTAATVANTSATQVNTAAKTANAVATAAVATAATATAAATATSAVSAATAAASVGVLAQVMGTLGAAARGVLTFVGGLPGLFILTLLNAKSLGEGIADLAARFTGLADRYKKTETALTALAAKEAAAAEARRTADAEREQASLRAADAAAKAVKAAEHELETSGKQVKAQEEAIKTTQELIKLRGTEQTGLDTLATQTETLRAAEEKALASREKLVDSLKAQVAAIESTADASGRLTEKQKDEVAKLRELINAKEAEVDRSKQLVFQLQIEAAERRIASETYKDNSARVKELAAAYESAKAKVEVLAASGAASMEQLRAAQIAAASAGRIFTDSVNDQIAAIGRKAAAEQAGLATSRATAEIGVTVANSMAAQARASGEYALALAYEVDAKNRQIDVAKQNVAIRLSEITAAQDQLEAEKRTILVMDDAGRARAAEIDLRIKKLSVQTEEVRGVEEQIKALERERDAMYLNNDRRNAGTLGINSDTEARGRNADAIARQTAELERQANNDFKYSKTQSGFGNDQKAGTSKETFTDSFGVVRNRSDGAPVGTFTNTVPIDQATALAEKQKRGYITADDKDLAEAGLVQARTALLYVQNQAKNSPGAIDTRALQDAQALYNAAQSAMTKVQGLLQSFAPATKTAATSTSAASSSTVTLKIQSDNSPTETVSVTDQQQADALLRALKNAGLTASR